MEDSMRVKSEIAGDGSVLTLVINGKFDFSLLNEFREAYSTVDARRARVVVNLHKVTSIDSSALGMLLNMQRTLGKADSEIALINCAQDVKKILQIVRFDKKFSIG